MIVCLDLEGVLVPEIWLAVASATGIEGLRRTTRDEPNYDKLMTYRLKILKDHDIRLSRIQKVIRAIRPLSGAVDFLNKLKARHQVIILSDTFYEFAEPLMRRLGHPTLFCNWLEADPKGFLTGYRLRQKDGKTKAVEALRGLGFKVAAAGDSYNDLGMLRTADRGVWFCPPAAIARAHRELPVARNYSQLWKKLHS